MLSTVNTYSNMPGFDLLVVGDGAVGMSVAIEFARRHPDARVAIIAPNGRANAASTAAGLMINAFAELEIGQLDDLRGRARFDLVRTAVQCWPDWLTELGHVAEIAPPLIRPGTIILGGGRADEHILEHEGSRVEKGQRGHRDAHLRIVDARDRLLRLAGGGERLDQRSERHIKQDFRQHGDGRGHPHR